MKKLSVLSLLMCVGSLTLAGCNNGSGGGGKKTTTGGATTSDSGSTGGTSSTSGTSGTSGTSTSSGPVYPTDWSDSLKSSMQELLDGVVLPYVPASWTAQSLGLPFGAMGDGVDFDTVKAAFDQAGYKASSIVSGTGVTPLEKDSEHGGVGVGLISVSATQVAIGATYLAYSETWSASDLEKFASKFGEGVTIPFARGYWSVNANPSWCSLSAVRVNNGGTADIIAAYEAAEGWTFKEYDAQQNPVYSYATTDGSTLEVNINVYNLRTYCDFSYVAATCEEWSAEDITFMNEQLAGGVLPHPAGLWSHPAIENNHVFTQEPLATTTLDAIKGVFEAAGFLVAVDPDDPSGYVFTKLAPELDGEDNPQYINGWIFLHGEIPAVEAYVGAPKVTDEFELYTSALSVHTGDSVTLTVSMGNLFTSEDVPQFIVSPADGAELVSSEGNQYVYQINAAVDTDVTITASVRDGAYSDSVVIHVEDSGTQTDWEDPILTNMTTALSGHKIPFVAGEWEETTAENTSYALRAPIASADTASIVATLTAVGYTEGEEQGGYKYYYTDVEGGKLYAGFAADEEYVYYVAIYIQVRTLQEVVADYNEIFSSMGLEFTQQTDGSYSLGLRFNSESDPDQYPDNAPQSVLVGPVATLYNNYSPDYLEIVSQTFWDGTTEETDYWGDGSTVFQLVLQTPCGNVGVEIIGYCYNGNLIGSISIYSL